LKIILQGSFQMNDKIRTAHDAAQLLNSTTEIVSAYIGKNSVDLAGLGTTIQSVYRLLAAIDPLPPAPSRRAVPAVPVRRSINPDYLICLEDGKAMKMLKRYLRTRYGLTPEQYRIKWSLPADYPMVAPRHSERRSAVAKKSGLGRNGAASGGRGGRLPAGQAG
jgi:predicted transcriptional regulator